MPHLGVGSEPHISIRLWQWLKDHPDFRFGVTLGFGPAGGLRVGAVTGVIQEAQFIAGRRFAIIERADLAAELHRARVAVIFASNIAKRARALQFNQAAEIEHAANVAKRNLDFTLDLRNLARTTPPEAIGTGAGSPVFTAMMALAAVLAAAATAKHLFLVATRNRSTRPTSPVSTNPFPPEDPFNLTGELPLDREARRIEILRRKRLGVTGSIVPRSPSRTASQRLNRNQEHLGVKDLPDGTKIWFEGRRWLKRNQVWLQIPAGFLVTEREKRELSGAGMDP